MDSLTVKEIARLATDAAAPHNRVIRPPAEPPHVYYLIGADGTAVRTHAAAPRERSACLSVPAVADWLTHLPAPDRMRVWYSQSAVVAEANREHRTTLELTPSEPFALLTQVGTAGREFDQGALWRLLRTTFRDALEFHPNLVKSVGQVDVRKAQEAAGTVDRKGTSVSRKLVAEASGADQLPEVVTFRVPFWAEAEIDLDVTVRCVLDFDANAERFRLQLLPGEVEAAVAMAEAHLREMIAAQLKARHLEAVALLHGTPEGE